MNYRIVQPPFKLHFREMSKDSLELYNKWFHEVIPEREVELGKAVASTDSFEDWRADMTPESLGLLGLWYSRVVSKRPRTANELREIQSRLSFPIEVPKEELTDRSFSIAVDIGMYFGTVFVATVPGCRWDQDLKRKSYDHFGQPIIRGRGIVPLNPVSIMVTLAYAYADKSRPPERLRELFEIWKEDLQR